MAIHPQQGSFRMLAKAVLGAFLFLFVASFLVLPCMTAATASSGLFSSVGGPQACQEHKIFKAQADLSRLVFLPAEAAFRFLVALPVLFAALALACSSAEDGSGSLRRRKRFRTGSLPFVTSDPPKTSAFAALRDA